MIGEKYWLLFPPEESTRLYDSKGQLPNSVLKGLSSDEKSRLPDLNDEVQRFECLQRQGDAIFVPSG